MQTRKMNKQLIAASLGLLGTCKIFAATPLQPLAIAPVGESAFFSELPVVLSVSRMEQTLHDAPGAITVIDAEMIRRSGARDMAELLRFVPGFQTSLSSEGVPVAVYHGMSGDVPRGMQLLIDGRSLSSPVSAGIPWEMIEVSLADIERIEVLRGSNAAAYGSNAFMGVVNVVTRSAASAQGAEFYATIGNQGVSDRYARFGGSYGEVGYRLSAEDNFDNGLARFFDDRRTQRVSFRADATLSAADTLTVDLGEIRVGTGTGYAPGETNAVTRLTKPWREVYSESLYGQLSWRHAFSEKTDLQVKYSRTERARDDVFTISLAPFATTQDERIRSSRDDFEMQHTAAWNDSLRTVIGLGFRRDEISGVFNYGAGVTKGQEVSRLFGQAEWRLSEAWVANLGGTQEEDSISGDSFSPRVMLNYHFLPMQTIKLGYTKARRLPSLRETYGRQELFQTNTGQLLFVGDRSSGRVQPEEVVQRELAYFGEFESIGLTADVRMFREFLKGWVVRKSNNITDPAGCARFEDPACSAPVYGNYDDFYNGVDAKLRGYEVQLTWKPRSSTTAILSYTEIGIHPVATIPGVSARSLHTVSRSAPSDSVAVMLMQTLPGNIELTAAWYDVSGYKWTDNTEVKRYQRLDWRVGYPFRLDGGLKGELAWQVRGDGGRHGEWNSRGNSAQWLYPRHFLSVRLAY